MLRAGERSSLLFDGFGRGRRVKAEPRFAVASRARTRRPQPRAGSHEGAGEEQGTSLGRRPLGEGGQEPVSAFHGTRQRPKEGTAIADGSPGAYDASLVHCSCRRSVLSISRVPVAAPGALLV